MNYVWLKVKHIYIFSMKDSLFIVVWFMVCINCILYTEVKSTLLTNICNIPQALKAQQKCYHELTNVMCMTCVCVCVRMVAEGSEAGCWLVGGSTGRHLNRPRTGCTWSYYQAKYISRRLPWARCWCAKLKVRVGCGEQDSTGGGIRSVPARRSSLITASFPNNLADFSVFQMFFAFKV